MIIIRNKNDYHNRRAEFDNARRVNEKGIIMRRTGSYLLALLAGLFAPVAATMAAEVNIYSYRKEALIRPQLEAFSKATGISYNLITGSSGGLLQRLRNEGRNSPADVLLTVDAGRLHRAVEMGLLQPIRSTLLEAAIPARFRDPAGHWFGLGIRARLIFYNIKTVKPSELSSYEALADAKWKGRLLVRSSSNIYNQSLLASMIHHNGKQKALDWARAIVANLARRPQGGDRDQLRAAAAGEGDIAIANSYYYARLLSSKKPADRKVTDIVKPFWPNQAGRGAHVNISGGGVAAHAPNRANAIRLLEFMVTPEAQRIYAEIGNELPVRRGVAPSAVVAGMGSFKMDAMPLRILGENNAQAVRLFDRAGWR